MLEKGGERERETYPAPSPPRVIQENQHKRRPKRAKQTQHAHNQPQHHTRRHDIPERLCAQEARKRIALHGLENVILGGIKNLGIVAALALDSLLDIVEDGLRQNDLALSAAQQVGVEDFLSAGADVGARDRVRGAVARLGGRARHEAGPWRSALGASAGRGHRALRAVAVGWRVLRA